MDELTIILASASPRRTQLLSEAGIDHLIHSVNVDEYLEPDQLKDPAEACKKLAERKASAAVESYLSDPSNNGMFLFLGADTMVVESGTIFGKPENEADAVRMLRHLSGNTHEVITAVSLWMVSAPESGEMSLYFRSFAETSLVTFHELDDEAIADYLACGESFDKAGAYAIQGEGARLVKHVHGDMDNVIGLPVRRLQREFPDFFGGA